MSITACHYMRFLLTAAVATTVASSAAEARHWRYYWHYHHGFYQERDEDRGQEPALRSSAIIAPAPRPTDSAGVSSK
jgi:hypothetical protein